MFIQKYFVIRQSHNLEYEEDNKVKFLFVSFNDIYYYFFNPPPEWM